MMIVILDKVFISVGYGLSSTSKLEISDLHVSEAILEVQAIRDGFVEFSKGSSPEKKICNTETFFTFSFNRIDPATRIYVGNIVASCEDPSTKNAGPIESSGNEGLLSVQVTV